MPEYTSEALEQFGRAIRRATVPIRDILRRYEVGQRCTSRDIAQLAEAYIKLLGTPHWTEERPIKPGWYWWREQHSGRKTVVHVRYGGQDPFGKKELRAYYGGVNLSAAGAPIDELTGAWQPVPETYDDD